MTTPSPSFLSSFASSLRADRADRVRRGFSPTLVSCALLVLAGLSLGLSGCGTLGPEDASSGREGRGVDAMPASVPLPEGVDIVAQDVVLDAAIPLRWQLPFLGVFGVRTWQEAPFPGSGPGPFPSFPRRADVRREVVAKVDLLTPAAPGVVDGLNICLTRSNALTSSKGTARGRLLVWKKSDRSPLARGWTPLDAHGTGGAPVPGRAAPVADVLLDETTPSLCVEAADRVNALLPGALDAQGALVVYENALLPEGHKDRLQLVVALRPRGLAFRSNVFSSKSYDRTAHFVPALSRAMPAGVLVPREYANFTQQYGVTASQDTTLTGHPLAGGAPLRVQVTAEGLSGFSVPPNGNDLPGTLGHWRPLSLRFRNEGLAPLNLRLFMFKANLSDEPNAPEFFDVKDVASLVLAPGETTLDASSLFEDAAPRANGGPRYRLVLGVRDARNAVVFAALKQGTAGEPIARGVTFPY